MSMFHELMMKSKSQSGQTIYATIKGSLTNNNNVITFDNTITNYLKLQQTIAPTTPFEIKIKFNYTYNSYAALFHSHIENDKYGIGLNVENDKLNYFVSTANSGAWAFDMYSDNSLSQDTDYYVRFGWTGTEYYADLSTDDVNYSRVISFSSNEEPRHDIAITQMGNYYDGMSLEGSIDLNNSYIKLGSTKYNLQAVVGWTKVGEPTIVDGVITRADASDTSYIYFKLNEIKNSIKVNMKFKVTSLNVNSYLFDPAGYSLSFRVSNANKIVCRIFPLFNSSKSYTVTGTTTIQADTWYWIRVDLNKERVIAYLSLDGITYTQDGSLEFETQMNFPHNFNGEAIRIGYSSASNLIIGSIDLNNTDVNIDNKLYFNGQQA